MPNRAACQPPYHAHLGISHFGISQGLRSWMFLFMKTTV